ncbi:hypothetical protein GCM10020331_043350 [Ectobacillus funiculus]
MIWDEEAQDKEMFQFVAQLISLRKKKNLAFGNRGTLQFVTASNATNHVMYTKTFEEQTVLFAFNNSDQEITVDMPFNLRGKKGYKLADGRRICVRSRTGGCSPGSAWGCCVGVFNGGRALS